MEEDLLLTQPVSSLGKRADKRVQCLRLLHDAPFQRDRARVRVVLPAGHAVDAHAQPGAAEKQAEVAERARLVLVGAHTRHDAAREQPRHVLDLDDAVHVKLGHRGAEATDAARGIAQTPREVPVQKPIDGDVQARARAGLENAHVHLHAADLARADDAAQPAHVVLHVGRTLEALADDLAHAVLLWKDLEHAKNR